MAWTVVLTRPSLEQRAKRNLERIGLECYLPRYRDQFRRRLALFPRYIFMKIQPGWQEAFRTDGVSRVFLSGQDPASVPHKFIRSLMACENKNGLIQVGNVIIGKPYSQDFREGQAVRVIRGAFANMIATFQSGVGVGHAKVLGRMVRVEFSRSDLAMVLA